MVTEISIVDYFGVKLCFGSWTLREKGKALDDDDDGLGQGGPCCINMQSKSNLKLGFSLICQIFGALSFARVDGVNSTLALSW